MHSALEDSGLEAKEIGHVNAHATATPTGDGPETKAISRTMPQAAVSATKSMTGHSFGAIGATEAIMCALALKQKVAPPTINLDDPEDVPITISANTVHTLPDGDLAGLNNSFGFGGHNVAVAVTTANT